VVQTSIDSLGTFFLRPVHFLPPTFCGWPTQAVKFKEKGPGEEIGTDGPRILGIKIL